MISKACLDCEIADVESVKRLDSKHTAQLFGKNV